MPYASVPTQRLTIEAEIVRRAWADSEYRARLLENPKAALEEALGMSLPERLQVQVVEERPDLMCIVIPVDVSGIPPETARVMLGVRPPPPSSAG